MSGVLGEIKLTAIDSVLPHLSEEVTPPCSPGCYNHVTHPCEKCGRIQGRIPAYSPALLQECVRRAQREEELRLQLRIYAHILNVPEEQVFQEVQAIAETMPGTFEDALSEWMQGKMDEARRLGVQE